MVINTIMVMVMVMVVTLKKKYFKKKEQSEMIALFFEAKPATDLFFRYNSCFFMTT